MLEALVAHLDSAAGATNGEAAVEAAAEPAVEAKKDDAAPTEVSCEYSYCFCFFGRWAYPGDTDNA